MKKVLLPVLTVFVLALAWSGAAWADTTDPTGFCAPPGSVPACTTGVGIGKETIPVGSSTFIMEKNGNGTSTDPWNLLVAIPNYLGAAPVITSPSFTQLGSAISTPYFNTSSCGSIYALFGLPGDSSMNCSNMFGANEVVAGGSVPAFFTVFDYTFTGSYGSFIPYTFNVGAPGLGAGTFLAATGGGTMGFSTPFTTAGLVNGPTIPSPEPGSLMMLGAGLLGLALLAGRRTLTV